MNYIKKFFYLHQNGSIRYSILNKTLFKLLRTSNFIFAKYKISNCRTINPRDLVTFKNPFFLNKPMHYFYENLKKIIRTNLQSDTPYSILRLGDGEAYFLQGKKIGNIKKRHLTHQNNLDFINLNEWRNIYKKNNVRLFDTNWDLRKLWLPFEGRSIKKEYKPLNTVYALIATKDIFRLSKGYKIGLIGSKRKLQLVEKLMEHKQYQKYLGINEFNSYIYTPDKGACNDIDALYRDIHDQISMQTSCDIYLVGMGIAKLALLHKIRNVTQALIIDIGGGMDALAGIVPKDKPYFADWVNYRISDMDYNSIDILSEKSSRKKLSRSNLRDDILL